MYLLSIDPGLSKCGVAYFDRAGRLVRAYCARRPRDCESPRGPIAWGYMAKAIDFENVGALVIEQMQVDTRTRGKERDLLEVCGVVGVLIGVATAARIPVHAYKPRTWKGNTPKTVTQARALDALTKEEKARINPNATHDTYDAIALGQFHMERNK